MYLGAQRVGGEGEGPSITLYLYLHGEELPGAVLRDVRWVSQLAPGQLAREHHEGSGGGRRVLSYLEVTGPDETDTASLSAVLDELERHIAAGGKGPIEHRQWGAELFCGAASGARVLEEFADLRAQIEGFFADGGTAPPHRALSILVSREGDVLRFAWDEASRERILAWAPGWTPTGLTIGDDVRVAFEHQYGVLFPHVLDMIRPDAEVDLDALGGVAIKDAITQKVLWFS